MAIGSLRLDLRSLEIFSVHYCTREFYHETDQVRRWRILKQQEYIEQMLILHIELRYHIRATNGCYDVMEQNIFKCDKIRG